MRPAARCAAQLILGARTVTNSNENLPKSKAAAFYTLNYNIAAEAMHRHETAPHDLTIDTPLADWMLDECLRAALQHKWPLKNPDLKTVLVLPGDTGRQLLSWFDIPD